MKILILDIDGVLNSTYWYKTRKRYPAPRTREQYDEMEFDPIALEMLNNMIVKLGLNVIVSSVWRLGDESFNQVKKRVKHVIGRTPHLPRPAGTSHEYCERGKEVEQWFRDRPKLEVTRYAIIDDDSDFLPWQKPLHIQTKFEDGLQFHHIEKAREILNVPVKERF